MASGSVLEGRLVAETLLLLLREYSPPGREEGAARVFMERARELGLEAWRDEAGSVYASASSRGPWLLALIGHIDTVPGWVEPRVSGGVVYGRGAVDAKGPLASMLHAAAAAGEGVVVAGLVGEEDDSRGARLLVDRGAPARMVIIGEPTGGDGIAIGYRGSYKLRVVCTSSGGHSSAPWMGDSALDKALSLVDRLREEYPGGSLWRSSMAVTGLCTPMTRNVLPTRAEVWLDARIPPGYSSAEMASKSLSIVEESGCIGEVADVVEPVRVSPSSPVPRSLQRALLSMGVRPRPVVKAGTSDMNLLAPIVDSIAAFGPGDPSLSHTPHERVSEDELEAAARVYLRAYRELRRVAGSSG